MKISLLIVAFNEIEGMKLVLPRIKKHWVDEVLVIDGGSTDGSIEFAQSLDFNVLIQKNKVPTGAVPKFFPRHASGVVEALKEGIAAVTGDYVITFTPDNNCVPEIIPKLVTKIKEGRHDMIVVSRYLAPAKSLDDTFLTAFGNRAITWLVNRLFKANYTDVMVIFRAYRKDLIPELGIQIKLSFHTELSIRCALQNKKILEIPGDEPRRIGGHTIRNNFKNGLIELSAIFEERLRSLQIRRNSKP